MNEEYQNRYKVVRTAFWWRVQIGDGKQMIGRCYTEKEAERLAAQLMRAFNDGYIAHHLDTTKVEK